MSSIKRISTITIIGFLFTEMFVPALINRSMISQQLVPMTILAGLFFTGGTLSSMFKRFSRKRRTVLLLLILTLLIGTLMELNVRPSSGQVGEWWNPDWAYRRKGVIWHTKIATDLTDFPVLIDINDSDLASYAQENGNDIVFIDHYGVKLNHEIEFFNDTIGHLIAWVRFPTLSSTTDTEFYMYYGNPVAPNEQNPEGVWDSTYLAVHHLEELSGNSTDSTANNKDATTTRLASYGAVGKIGYGKEFLSAGQVIQLPQVFSSETQFTFSAWINASSNARYFISQWYNLQGAFLQVYGNYVEFYVNNVITRKPISLNEWHYVVATYDGTAARLYIDGGSPSSASSSLPIWPSQSMYFGNRYDYTRTFKGIMDEVRISNVARSVGWIATEHSNEYDPSSFFTIQHEDMALLSNPLPQDGATRVSINPTLSIRVVDPMEHQMTVIFMGNSSGTWEELGTHIGGSGIYCQATTSMGNFNTTYHWMVCALDSGSGLWSNKTYSFTTILMLELKWVANVPAEGANQLHPAIGDINGDGIMEVVMSGNGVVVALNGMDGSELWRYSPAVHRSITLADLTDDGVPEILAAQGEGLGRDRVIALFGNGTLYWQSPILTGDALCDFPVTAYDIDGDGYPTIYFATEDQDGSDGYSGRLTALNHKGEVLASTQVFHPCTGGPTVADYDFDGVFEVYMGDRNYDIGMGLRSWWAENLTSRWNQTAVLTSSAVPVLVDFNNDGKLEVIGLSVPDNGVIVVNASSGQILQDDRHQGLRSHATPTVYDIDRDGRLEVILSMSRDYLAQDFVIWDLGRRKLDARIDISKYGVWAAWPPTVGDVNGDGLMEIIAALGTEPGEGNGGNSAANAPILIYDAPSPNTYRQIAEIPVTGAGCLTFARVQDIDNDCLNEVVVAGINGKVLAYDTVSPTPQPRPRTEVQYYSEYRRGAAKYVEPPGPPEPKLLNEYPADGATGIPPNPTLSLRAHDFQNDVMTVVIETNASGSWEKLGTYSGGNGIYSQPTVDMFEYGHTYFWSVNATDNKGHSTFKTFKFTTMPWWNKSWHYRKLVTIDHTKVTSNLSNFAVLIDTTDPDLASHAQMYGDDIVFIDRSGNKLNHEIELFDKNSGRLVAWVMIPTLSSTEDTVLYMYYGNAHCKNQENPEGVWDSNFIAVHHLEEESGNVTDSTAMRNDAKLAKVTTYQAPGQIGKAVELNGINDYIELPQILSTETQFTFSAWVYAKPGARYFISQWYSSRGVFLQVYASPSGNRVEFYINSKLIYKSITLNEWHYVVATYDGTTAALYVDAGTPSTTSSSSPLWPSQSMYLGDRYDHTRKYKGSLDEVRISNASRSRDWIITEYNNQRSPSLFCMIGNQEHANTPPTASEVTLTPINPRTNDDLVGHYVYEDLDGDPESGTEIRWYKNSELQPDLNDTLTVPHHLTAKGKTWYFTVTPCDGDRYGETVASNALTILNSPPSIDWYAPESLTSEVPEGSSLEFTHTSSDPDGDTLAYSWLLDDVLQASTQNWTYMPGYDEAGFHNATLAVSDGQLETILQWNITVVDVNRPPTAPTIEITPTPTYTVDDLNCTIKYQSPDPDGDSITYIYQWYKDGILQPELTGNTVPNQLTNKTETWKCIVTPYDGKGYGPQAEAQVTIQNSPPQIDTCYPYPETNPAIPIGQSQEFNVTCSDLDEDVLTVEWWVDGELVQNQTGVYESTYSSPIEWPAGIYNVTVVVKDNESQISYQWTLTIQP